MSARSTRRTTRKRDESDEPQPQHASESATLAAAATSAASSVPDSKRPRRSSRTHSSTSSAADHKQEEEEEEEEEGQNKGGTDDAAARIEVQHGASDEEDADAAMAEATDSLLDSLRVATAGHLFSAATVAGRPALPLLAVACVCDFVTAADIVLRLAPTARTSYATAVEYAQMVAQSAVAASEAEATPAGSKKQSSRKRGRGGKAAAPAAEPFSTAPTAAGNSVGRRSEVSVFTSVRALTLLCASRLRSIVSGIRTRSAKQGGEVFPLDARLLGRISDAIPTLTSLQCQLSSFSPKPAFDFPVGLRELNLSLKFFKARPVPAAKRGSRLTKPAKSWSTTQCNAFAEWAVSEAAALPSLTTLTLSASDLPRRSVTWGQQPLAASSRSWIDPLVSTPSLRHFTCDLDPTKGHWATRADWPAALRQLVQLESLSGTLVQAILTAILQAPHCHTRLQRLPLETLQLTPALLQSLKTVPSLTDLWPDSFANVDNISFIQAFPELQRIGIFEQGPPPEPAYWSSRRPHTPGATAPTAQHIVETIESLSPARRAQIESIGVGSDSWTNELVLRLLTALPGLIELELRSKEVTGLAAFSSIDSLRSSLKVLRLQTPSVPRDDVTHLHALLQLERLSIEGSFSEPLYSKQLLPFQPPYPKQPLHWLRSFVPRSSREPVPTPPVDLAAKAAADADFSARVHARQVSPAESLHPAQLSSVQEYLDVKGFSIAARACRVWRMAASLPTAWTRSHAGATASADLLETSRGSLGGGAWTAGMAWWSPGERFTSELFRGRGRVLSISAGQCSVLPRSLLWRHATGVRLSRANYEPGLRTASERKRAHQESMLAIAQLPRLEALSVRFDENDSQFAAGLVPKLTHLRRLEACNLPTSVFTSLASLVELSVTGSAVADGSPDGQLASLGHELALLHCLRRLVIFNYVPTSELAEVLRVLSRDHALRELDIDTQGADLADFFRTLAGQSSDVGSSDIAEAMDTEQLAPASSSVCGLPALLTRLRVTWMTWDPHKRGPLTPLSVMRLPLLRHFELQLLDACDLGELAAFVDSGARLPSLETLVISTLDVWSLHSLELFGGLRELRLCGSRGAASVGEHVNSRWASRLLSLQRLEILSLEGVQTDPLDVALLDQLPQLRALTFSRQRSLRVCDLAVLPRIRGLTELQLDNNPQLLLQRRDWLKDIGRKLPGESATAAMEMLVDAAAQAMRDVEEQTANTEAKSAPAAVAAASSSAPVLLAATDGLLPVLLQCRSLRLLHWSSSSSCVEGSEQYTSQHSWVQPSSRVRCSPELRQHRINKERARERQALRSLISANPQLTVKCRLPRPPVWPRVLVPPQAGSPAEMETKAAAEAARKLKSDWLYEDALASNPLLLAYEDRALLAIEAQEEQEWRTDAERKAELAKQEEQNKKRRKG